MVNSSKLLYYNDPSDNYQFTITKITTRHDKDLTLQTYDSNKHIYNITNFIDFCNNDVKTTYGNDASAVELQHINSTKALRINNDSKFEFRDANNFIHSDSNNNITLNAGSNIKFDINNVEKINIDSTKIDISNLIDIRVPDQTSLNFNDGSNIMHLSKDINEGTIRLFNGFNKAILRGPETIVIDPDISGNTGKVIIRGDLEITGTQTIVQSTVVEISDNTLKLASNATSLSQAQDAGLTVDISNDGSANFLYDYDDLSHSSYTIPNRWVVTGTGNANKLGLEVQGSLYLNDNLHTSSNNVKIPTSYSTFAIVDSSNLNNVLTTTPDSWIKATGYDISMTRLSRNSAVKLEFKINYITSPEAGQMISFKITRGGPDNSNNIVFQDSTLGTVMGVTAHGIYNGTFIDSNAPTNTNDVSYQLYFWINYGSDYSPTNEPLDISCGILGYDADERTMNTNNVPGNNYNFICIQELYRPESLDL